MRQARIQLKAKLELRPPSSDESEDDGSESARQNPFALSDSDDEQSESQSESSDAHDVILADMSGPIPKTVSTVKTVASKPDKSIDRCISSSNIFALHPKHFDCIRQVQDQDTPMPIASARGSLALQSNLWLLPHSKLMADLKKAKSGVRWVEYNPENEMYFKMNKVGNEEYNWEPTERYLATWHALEMFMGTNDLNGVFEFLSANPYHPAANLCVAEYYIMQDQFDTAHQYLERALSSFQYGLSPSLNLLKVKRPRLKDLDLRRMAQALSTVGDDLIVDWTGEETSLSRQDREAEIRKALSVAENGNLMFCRTVQMYALSLAQRGFSRAALECFRLINVMTLGNDVAHSLPFVAEAAVRSRSHQLFHDYNEKYLTQVAQINFQALSLERCEVPTEFVHSFFDKLECIFPWFLFGQTSIFVLQSGLRMKQVTLSSVNAVLDQLTAQDFHEYASKRILEPNSSEGMEATMTNICLSLLFAIWLHPNFPLVLQKSETVARGVDEMNKLSTYELFTTKNLFACEHEMPCNKLRQQFLEAYVMQTKSFWKDYFVSLILPCCAKIGKIHSVEVAQSVVPHADLLHGGFCKHSIFLDQYRGIRQSEFDEKKPVLSDALINSSTESVDTTRGYILRHQQEQAGFAGTRLGRWINQFISNTRDVNVRENAVINFIQTLMPWTRLDYS